MRLDRNIEANKGVGKYALVLLRKVPEDAPEVVRAALRTLETAGVLDWGSTPETEFFVIRLKDANAHQALIHYGHSASLDDPEWANEIYELARRSGPFHPQCKKPD